MLRAVYQGRRALKTRTASVYMYDTGVTLRIENAPENPYFIEFEDGQKATPINNVVEIPDELFQHDGEVELFLVVKDGESVNTLCAFVIPVLWRPAREQKSN